MANIYDMSDAWNDAGTTFTAIKMDVTDTASASGSLLMDLQVGGASKFKVNKDGAFSGPSGLSTTYQLQTTTNGLASGTPRILLDPNAFGGVVLSSLGAVIWTDGTTGSTKDLILARDAANTLAQRRDANAQTFNLYNTYTDSSNYERGFMRYVSNRLEIGHEAGGTGTAGRTLAFRTQGFDVFTCTGALFSFGVNVSIASASITAIRDIQSQTGFTEMIEMTAPAAGSATSARIFAQDNGSGKTQLMVQFGSGAAQQIAIEP